MEYLFGSKIRKVGEMNSSFFYCGNYTLDEFEKQKDRIVNEHGLGSVVTISDTNSAYVCVDFGWEEICTVNANSTAETTAHHTLKITNCVHCNAPLNLYRVTDEGACKCDYCGNWNLIYKENYANA